MNIKNIPKAINVFWGLLPPVWRYIFVSIAILLIFLVVSPPNSVYLRTKSNPESNSQWKGDVVGSWYDDVGSPGFMDATFNILRRGDSYYLYRKNGDGSTGTYPLLRDGRKYIKINDKFGAYYVVSDNGLEIYDSNGFIRTARRK